MKRISAVSELSYEQYAAWAVSRFPGYREEPLPESDAYTATEPPVSSDACPVTVRSEQQRIVVTPNPRGSR